MEEKELIRRVNKKLGSKGVDEDKLYSHQKNSTTYDCLYCLSNGATFYDPHYLSNGAKSDNWILSTGALKVFTETR